MSVVYFKANQLDVYILVSFTQLIKNQKVILNELRFFKEENELQTYVKQNTLKIMNEEDTPDIIKDLIKLIKEYFSGENINLFEKIRDLKIDLAIDEKFTTNFSKKVIDFLIEKVGFAKYTTYSEIGEKIGSKAYRAIGNLLKKNPLPLIIPCHRVIRKDGDIGGFMGSTDNKWQQNLKKKLLEIEGSYQKISV